DDVKHIDWKVFARTERYFLKQYELETDMICWLLVDASESMAYGSGEMTKYEYACAAAAAIAYLILHQSDSVGLATVDSGIRRFLRPAAQPTHWREILKALSDRPSAAPTQLGPSLHELAGRINRRGLVMLLSDLFDDIPAILSGLKRLDYDRH